MSAESPPFARSSSSSVSMALRRVLVVLSGEGKLPLKNGKTVNTGFFLSELIIPVRKLLDAGYVVTYANPTGRQPPMDPLSDNRVWFGFSKAELDRAKAELETQLSGPLRTPMRLMDLTERDLSQFDALFIPGGHAPMIDLWQDQDMGRILNHFHVNNKITAAICHGPAALLSAQGSGDAWPYAGYKMTCYSNLEENMNEVMFRGRVPFKLASKLSAKGATISNRLPLLSNVVVDRELITGQGPTSVWAFADALVAALVKRAVPVPPPPPPTSSVRESTARQQEGVSVA